MPCAVMLAFALLSTGCPCELIHNFVFISVFRFDFGGFFLFIIVNRVWWLAKLDWTSDGRSDAEACGTHSPKGDQSRTPQ